MGDRANVVVREGKEEVWLYSHWGGTELPQVVRAAMARGTTRWTDPGYLARIVFCEMVKGREMGETGYGIWSGPCDNEHDVLVLNTGTQIVEVYKANWNLGKKQAKGKPIFTCTFADFVTGTLTPEEALARIPNKVAA